MSSADLKIIRTETVENIEHDSDVQPGQWWWYHKDGVPGAELKKVDDDEDLDDEFDDDEYEDDDEDYDEDPDRSSGPVLVCVMKIGSNFVKVKTVQGYNWRQRTENWYDYFLPAHNADEHIRERQEGFKNEVQRLLGEVHEITRRLGVSKQTQLPEQTTQALVVRGGDTDYDDYKKALVKAKNTDIPAIYSQMSRANEALAKWLQAPTIPMSVMVTDQQEIIDAIKRKVFSVELYAGLQENVIQFADGEPAALHEKLHLMQRRHYMDEECLSNYETGGMSFGNIGEFDEWLARPENRDRIFPFPRCMVAFKVRRHGKQFTGYSLWDFIEFRDETFNDENTYLYIRNGEQLYCLETGVEFGEKLFPDLEHSVFTSGQRIYARKDFRDFDLMTEGEWLDRIAELDRRKEEWKAETKAWRKARDAWEALPKSKQKEVEEPSYFGPSEPWDSRRVREYQPFTPENLYHDDIVEYMKRQAEEYNRISLIIQGLFDRSPILHPHPKVVTWTPEGFDAAIELHYDSSQALTSGDPPDFEAFRAKLNESLDVGSKTIGQGAAYDRFVKEKEEERGRYGRQHDYGRGPGKIAEISEWKPRARKAVFRWSQDTQDWKWEVKRPTKPRRFEVPASKLLNLDAYQPGDFKQFYEDPRTRADYAKWAYYLLLAEEYYAGNVGEDGRPQTKANAHHCDRCGETWYRSHSCSGRKKKRRKKKAKA